MELKNHDLTRRHRRPRACATRSVPLRDPAGRDVDGPAHRLDHARQPRAAQLLHDRDGEGRDPRHARGLERPGLRGRGLHRRRHARLLHRRQHRGVRRVLRRPARGVPPVHAALQRHGQRHPGLRQAGDLPRQRHAHRRRPGDRHGLRLLDRAGPRHGSARPVPKHGSAPGRRQHRLPAALRRHRGGDGELHAVRAWSAHKAQRLGLLTGPCRRSRWTDASCRTRWSSPTAGSTDGPHRASASSRPARSAGEGQGAPGARPGRPDACSTARWTRSSTSSPAPSPAVSPRPSRACASTSSSTGTGTRRRTAPGSVST